MAWATSFSLAWITGAVAAMAEPPQIEEPTPIKVASFVSSEKKRWKRKATIKAIEMVDRMTGSEDCPTAKTCEILRPKPSKITAYWSNFLELKVNPASSCLYDERKGCRSMPIKIAKTGAPITGKNPPKYQDRIEMRRQAKMPAPFFDRNDIKTSK